MKLNPQTKHIEMLKNLHPRFRYAAGSDFAAWQKSARARLNELLGLPLETCAPDVRIEWQKDMGTYTETRFLFASEPGVDVLCHLLLPKAEEKVPLVICLQGHSKGMHISLGRPKFPGDEESIAGGDRDFAPELVYYDAEGYEIEDPEIPLDPNPKTGDSSVFVIALAIASIALAALYIKRRQVIED